MTILKLMLILIPGVCFSQEILKEKIPQEKNRLDSIPNFRMPKIINPEIKTLGKNGDLELQKKQETEYYILKSVPKNPEMYSLLVAKQNLITVPIPNNLKPNKDAGNGYKIRGLENNGTLKDLDKLPSKTEK